MASLWDDEGREYVDCGASFGVANLGHANPEIAAAIEAQARELVHVGPTFGTPAKARFLEKLLAVSPPNLTRAFLSNSGTEAVEAAIKFARAATKRKAFVAAMRGFHGRTMGALSATWRRDFREPFEPLVPGFSHVPFNDVAALEQAVTDETAGVILECVQGEGGVYVADPEYLPAAREICDRHGALLILDEVQTGMGRTGRLFALERWNVRPDIVTLAKSLAAFRSARPSRPRTSSPGSRGATTRRSAGIRSHARRGPRRSTTSSANGSGNMRRRSARRGSPGCARWTRPSSARSAGSASCSESG
jgi:acetylornithine/LysW-gamma-L-lysine aminotransferase